MLAFLWLSYWDCLYKHSIVEATSYKYVFKVAYTSGPIFEKIMKRYPIFSLQIINYQIDLKHK